MHKKAVSLIINPRTGENTASLQAMLAVFAAAGWKTEVRLKEYGKHVMKLSHGAVAKKRDLVVGYGGDGTLNQVVNGVMSASAKGKLQCAVGLIPGGTANVWAGEIGVPTDPVKAALTLVNSEERKVDVGRIAVCSLEFPGEEQSERQDNDRSGETITIAKAGKRATKESCCVRHHFLLMAGIGLDAAIMRGVSKPLKYNIGPLAVGFSAAKEIPGQRPFPMEILSGKDGEKLLWRGEAIQLVIGNSRRYAKVEKITPDAYVDDGALDLCVITSGTPLNTIQQITSLLLRQKPASTTAEYFRGAHLRIRVPANVPFQVDGSDVKLKDYLSAADYKRLKKLSPEELSHVLVTYQLDTLPRALEVAVPLTYDNELFKGAHDGHKGAHDDEHNGVKPVEDPEHPEHIEHIETRPARRGFIFGRRNDEHDKEGVLVSAAQRQTLAAETLPTTEATDKKGSAEPALHARKAEERTDTTEQASELLKNKGHYITVVGRVPDPAHPHTYIIAGTMHKASTGEKMPVAVVVNDETTLVSADGQEFTQSADTLQELAEGDLIVVDGKRNKRNVLRARKVALV